MTGWLVYSPDGYARNRWFADRLVAAAAEKGIALALRTIPDNEGLPTGPLPDIAVVRTIRPDLSAALEASGVRVVNNAVTSRIANDKWETYRLARELDIPVLPTVRVVPSAVPQLTYPCVLKSTDGHGGGEVFLVHDADEAVTVMSRTGKQVFVAQPLCDEPGQDMRVYALGGKVVAAVLRTSRKDFRSNFSLGGEAVAVCPDPGVCAMVRLLQERLGFDFAGVDFIRHGGRWVLNEIEDVVGTRMLYATGDMDAARLLVERLVRLGG